MRDIDAYDTPECFLRSNNESHLFEMSNCLMAAACGPWMVGLRHHADHFEIRGALAAPRGPVI
ncbi:hypothetical protein [Caballeronia calidae]|uniref:hypothetical protein n=1 Tax=Caballeronia calidae TaxID=1777139 RepID=UPI000AB51B6E|nr:hypothetical protein [Caballeronia calidae]